jgi:hypothetical protein
MRRLYAARARSRRVVRAQAPRTCRTAQLRRHFRRRRSRCRQAPSAPRQCWASYAPRRRKHDRCADAADQMPQQPADIEVAIHRVGTRSLTRTWASCIRSVSQAEQKRRSLALSKSGLAFGRWDIDVACVRTGQRRINGSSQLLLVSGFAAAGACRTERRRRSLPRRNARTRTPRDIAHGGVGVTERVHLGSARSWMAAERGLLWLLGCFVAPPAPALRSGRVNGATTHRASS